MRHGNAQRVGGLLGLAILLCSPLCLKAGGDTPVQLLVPDKNRTGLAVVESALAMIERIEGPVAVVAITGPYHTGKSFLMNQLADFDASTDGNPELFGVGRGVDPETSGIWMYHRPVSLADNRTMDVLFLDTEGFSVSNVSESYDAQVFAASTMLSSMLLYNSMHLLHASELEYLDLLVHNTQLFSIKTAFMSDSNVTTAAVVNPSPSVLDLFNLPPLLISVQAFTVDLRGEACYSWLSRLLQAPVRSAKDAQHMGLGSLFPSISCNTLFLPATSRHQLNNLASLPRSHMTEDFRADLSELYHQIAEKLQPKTSRGQALTGPGLAALIRLVVSALSSGGLSDIPGRWDLFETHLRQSSSRATLMTFEKEVRQRLAAWGRPVTQAELTGIIKASQDHASALLKRLLLGLDLSLKRAEVEVARDLKESVKQFQTQNAAAVKVYLRDKADDAADADREAVKQYRDQGLPVPSKELEEWAKQREAKTVAQYRARAEIFKGEASFTAEAKEVADKAKGYSDNVRVKNQEALTEYLEGLKSKAFDAYRRDVDKMVGTAVYLPDAIMTFHNQALSDCLKDYDTGGGRFKAEKAFDLYQAKLKVETTARLQEVKKEASERLRAVCLKKRQEMTTLVASRVALLSEEVFDEEELERGLAEAARQSQAFSKGIEHLKNTEEFLAVQRELAAEVVELQQRARIVLAERIKRVLEEPLNEVCKRIIEAKCPTYTSVSAFTKDTMKECSYFVRRHEIGKKLSAKMMTQVITQFIESDLKECRNRVALEEARQRFWYKVSLGVGAVIALAAYFRYNEIKPPEARPLAYVEAIPSAPSAPYADYDRPAGKRGGRY